MLATHVAFVVDNSGSMYHVDDYYGARVNTHIVPSLPEALTSLARSLWQKQITTAFHVFSDSAISGPNLPELLSRQAPSGTNIASGFEAMAESRKHGAQKVVVVFVSDGDDSRREASARRWQRLPPLPESSTLLTVAVGRHFPTSMVLTTLYPRYNTAGDASLPLVFPIDPGAEDSAEVMAWIKEQLLEVILEVASGEPRKPVQPSDLEGKSNQEVFAQCRRWYNECTIQTLLPGRTVVDKIAGVQDCRAKLAAADGLMRRNSESLKPLLTSSLRKQLSVHHLTGIREKLNCILAQLNKGRLFEDLNDQEKKDYLAYGNVSGRLLARTVKYRGANAETTIASLERMLRSYERNAFDDSIVDSIHLCSLSEILLDAKANTDMFAGMRSMADILKAIAFIGRSVQLAQPVPDCVQMNPWLVTVVKLPCTLKYVNTHDLFASPLAEAGLQSGQRRIVLRDETIDSLLILGGDPDCPGVPTHIQTFATTRNWLCYHNDARLAMAGAILVHLLSGAAPLEQWKLDELALLRAVVSQHTPSNSRWWHEYCAALDKDFRSCLVTESDQLPPCLRCPGLNKFVLAVWVRIEGGRRYTYTELRELYLAMSVEFLGRCKAEMKDYIQVTHVAEVSIETPWEKVLDRLHQAKKPMRLHQFVALLEAEIRQALKKTKRGPPLLTVRTAKLQLLTYYGMSLPRITAIFASLARMCDSEEWPQLREDELWPQLREDELVRALLINHHSPSSLERNQPHGRFIEARRHELSQEVAQVLAAGAERELQRSLFAQARQRVDTYLQMRHAGLPRMIPAEHMQRYLAETGHDVARDFRVDPTTGLSAVACCHPACDAYLNTPSGLTEKQQRSALKAHLAECCKYTIPGFHKCVAQHAAGNTSEVLAKVVNGECLKPPFPSRSFGAAPYESARLALLQRKQQASYRRSLEAYTAGDSIALYHLIEEMQDHMAVKAWTYEEFKRTFDGKYAAAINSPTNSPGGHGGHHGVDFPAKHGVPAADRD
jgi:hypothetical protein